MKFCPNPQCPFAVRFKRAAEYQNTATACSDCGTTLGDVDVSPAPPSAVPKVVVVAGSGRREG